MIPFLALLLFAGAIPTAPYASWAHHHWVWLGHSVATQESLTKLTTEYLSHGIEVGAVNCDSTWSNGVNDFTFNTAKYPDAAAFVSSMHDKGIKVILWATSMVDTDCVLYDYAKEHSYFIRDAINRPMPPIKWWHGKGCLIDYWNPTGLEWWHSQLSKVLNIGVDGFKVDGTDPYINELVTPRRYEGKYIDYRDYANAYYTDFFNFSRTVRGPEALIMSRPVDSFDKIVSLRFSPRDVVFAGWVGDQDPTFSGLKDALFNMRKSADDGYVGFGSDVGGYRSGGPPPFGRTTEVFTRWFQLGAFSSLFENGGENEHRPWIFGNSTLVTYRNLVDIHYSLESYLLSAGSVAFADGHSIYKFTADYEYYFGPTIFVACMTDNSTRRTLNLPSQPLERAHSKWKSSTAAAVWVSMFDPTKAFPGGQAVSLEVPMDQFPAFTCSHSLMLLNLRVSGTTVTAQHPRAERLPVLQAVLTESGSEDEFWHEMETLAPSGKGSIAASLHSAQRQSTVVITSTGVAVHVRLIRPGSPAAPAVFLGAAPAPRTGVVRMEEAPSLSNAAVPLLSEKSWCWEADGVWLHVPAADGPQTVVVKW